MRAAIEFKWFKYAFWLWRWQVAEFLVFFCAYLGSNYLLLVVGIAWDYSSLTGRGLLALASVVSLRYAYYEALQAYRLGSEYLFSLQNVCDVASIVNTLGLVLLYSIFPTSEAASVLASFGTVRREICWGLCSAPRNCTPAQRQPYGSRRRGCKKTLTWRASMPLVC